jgi:hypothetical protein
MTVSALEALVNQIDGQHRAALENLQAQFDVLAAAHANEIERNTVLTMAIMELKRKIDPRVAPDLAPFAKFVLPTDNAPGRRRFDAAGLLASIAERQRG